MLQNFLQNLGLTDKEARVYLALLAIGSNAVSIIAKKSELTRTTVYSVLQSLQRRGFVKSYEKNGIIYYQAEQPELVLSLLDQKVREINLQKRNFQELLPEFHALINKSATIPKVRYFEGLDGLKEIYEDTLKEGKEKLAYGATTTNRELQSYLRDYVQRRAAAGLSVRAIFPDTQEVRCQMSGDEHLLRSTRLVPADKFPFKSEINIYGNKIAYMSLRGPDFHGVIIESEEISQTEKAIFELAWLGAATKFPQT